MNRERVKELLPIFEAFVEGKDIEFRPYQYIPNEGDPHLWSDLPKEDGLIMTFPCDDYEYRIKPTPREFWIDPTGSLTFQQSGYIKVREVIE